MRRRASPARRFGARRPGRSSFAIASGTGTYRDMSTLLIDGRTVPAADGPTILDAARAAGIEIPTLCWYPTLPIVGNCRICLVSVEGQPKLIPACATKVADGLVVTTRSHAAVENRRGVLKLLAERYPAAHLRNGGRPHPPNAFARYRLEDHVVPTPLEA